MPSRDRNIVNGLYDITNLTWRDLIGAANIPAAVKFYVMRIPRPFFEGRAPRDYKDVGIAPKIFETYMSMCILARAMKLSIQAYQRYIILFKNS